MYQQKLRNLLAIIPQKTPELIEQMRLNLMEESQLTFSFLALSISACLIASFGLLSNSVAVIIGAMIIAPLMLPLRGVAFGALEGDTKLFKTSFISLISATILAIFLSALIGKIISLPEFGSEVLNRTQPNLIDLGIAIVAGGMSGLAKVKPKISDAVVGTAIAVALMPPLCVVGLSLSQGLWSYSWGAFLLYLTNFLGIILACMIIFICNGYTQINHALSWTLILTAILLIPLGISFLELLAQAQLQYKLKKILLNQTVTVGQQVQLINTQVKWNNPHPIVYLNVKAKKQITSKQVKLLEEFIEKQMGKKFIFVFEVNQITEVRAES
ncbi:MAG TPA: DUF389 domain-containing protein [Allocoleopsis sp.]